MNSDLSVIICTHNPRRDYLRRTLEALKCQTLPSQQWELLLIDNASEDLLANKWNLSWHPQARIIRENQLGLTFARLRGIKEAKGELLVFVDDDNVLAPSYCSVSKELALVHPQLGCIGAGTIEPEYEVTPPAELLPHLAALSLRSVAKPVWSNIPGDNHRPFGAGLIVRKVVAERYRQVVIGCQLRKQLGRTGAGFNSGEDEEFSWISCDLGLGKGLFPELKLQHLIAARRISREYLFRIAEGHGFSQALLAHLHHVETYYPPVPSTIANILANIVRMKVSISLYHASAWWSARQRSGVDKDMDAAWRCGVEKARKMLNLLQVC